MSSILEAYMFISIEAKSPNSIIHCIILNIQYEKLNTSWFTDVDI